MSGKRSKSYCFLIWTWVQSCSRHFTLPVKVVLVKDKHEQTFAPSLFVEVRKRLRVAMFSGFESVIIEMIGLTKRATGVDSASHRDHFCLMRRLLIVDPLSNRYEIAGQSQTDLRGSVWWVVPVERSSCKPRTYHRKARRQYLLIAKKRRVSIEDRHRGSRGQLQYLRRNLKHIANLLDAVVRTPFSLTAGRQRHWPERSYTFVWNILNCLSRLKEGRKRDNTTVALFLSILIAYILIPCCLKLVAQYSISVWKLGVAYRARQILDVW